ncbi:Lipase 3 [Psilocybe cubensis]|uniref:Carboxylesterase type B domain-containing protein n=2 Tax=Psilocybe cubensis TaxID=181762 RepID=A0A8H7XRY2_PSICU|nr:Lipase 3 [Psilocybe cubensis]KAH9477763.1 Lipase 3 [Psilocybe cubensis]
MPVPGSSQELYPKHHHLGLEATFCGLEHPLSTPDTPIHQFLGIKYAHIPARFRQSVLCTTYPPIVDASKHGPICPQQRATKSMEETLFGIPLDEIPNQNLKQDEFECLNLNITCPAGLTPDSRLPVMIWVHGGGDRGSGSEWYYDGGAIVRKSIRYNKPIILVTFNYDIASASVSWASPPTPLFVTTTKQLASMGPEIMASLRDQRNANDWVHRYISEFGGDPNNITLFGSGSGAADIVCHLLSQANLTRPIFHQSIIQSPVFEPTLPDVGSAGWCLSRVVSALQLTNIEKYRNIEVEKLLGLGQTLRVVDDRVFFRDGWQNFLGPKPNGGHSLTEHSRIHHGVLNNLLRPTGQRSKSRSRSRSAIRNLRSPSRPKAKAIPTIPEHTHHITQPIIIGDSSADSYLWSNPISLWTSAGVVRRLKAVCQSLSKTSAILRAYDVSQYTPEEEITERVLELVNDARVAWPTHCIAQNAAQERGDHGVWRFVFDQEGPSRGIPHHAADLMYLFDNVPLPASAKMGAVMEMDMFSVELDDDVSDELEDEPCVSPGIASPCPGADGEGDCARGRTRCRGDSFSSALAAKCESIAPRESKGGSSSSSSEQDAEQDEWLVAPVDEYSYCRVRDAMQERWISFAYGEVPWREDKVFVFGPEGETGERSREIFEGRRRRRLWSEALEPLGAALVQKLGVELSRGPAHGADR